MSTVLAIKRMLARERRESGRCIAGVIGITLDAEAFDAVCKELQDNGRDLITGIEVTINTCNGATLIRKG